MDGYSTEENDGYSADESDGYNIRTVENDVYRAGEKDEYSTVENKVYSTLENERYNTVEKKGYMTEESDGYRTAVKDGLRTDEKDEYNTEENAGSRTEKTYKCSTAETGANITVENEIDLVRKDKTRVKEDSETTFIEMQTPRSHEGQNLLCARSDIRSRQPTYTDLRMQIVDSAVQSDHSFALYTQCKVKKSCSKKKKRKEKVKNKFVETYHGQTQLTNAKMQVNCLGKYIEAAKQGINATLPTSDDDKGPCISLDSPKLSNKKDEISFERYNGNEMNRRDHEPSFESHNTKESWEMWDSDEEPSISTELEQVKMNETRTSNCLGNGLTNQLLAVHGEIETSVGGWW